MRRQEKTISKKNHTPGLFKRISSFLELRKFLFIFYIILLATNTVNAAEENESVPRLLSYYEFSILNPNQKVTYLEGLQSLAIELEALQLREGAQFQSAFHQMFDGFKVAISASSEAMADEGNKPLCIYAGNISEYSATNKRICQNKFRGHCGPGQILCNELLYGSGKCTSSRDGASARCDRIKVNLQDLANQITASKREEWNAFKLKFESFCEGTALKSKKNKNYKSCLLVQKRINAITLLLKEPPVAAQEPVAVLQADTPAAPAPAPKILVQTNVCQGSGQVAQGTCLKCPDYALKEERDLSAQSYNRYSKYGQLVGIMKKVCPIPANRTKGETLQSEDQMIRRLGQCVGEHSLAGPNEFSSKSEAELILKLKTSTQEALSQPSGLFQKGEGPASAAMSQYFGISLDEAREIFCLNSNSDRVQEVLTQPPQFSFTQEFLEQLKTIPANDQPLRDLPSAFKGLVPKKEEGEDPLQALNKFRQQKWRRKKMADCFRENQQNSKNKKVLFLLPTQPKCSLEKLELTNLSTGIPSFSNSDVCVQNGSQSTVCSVTSTGQVNCSAEISVNEKVSISRLVCGSAPAGVHWNTPDGNHPGGADEAGAVK